LVIEVASEATIMESSLNLQYLFYTASGDELSNTDDGKRERNSYGGLNTGIEVKILLITNCPHIKCMWGSNCFYKCLIVSLCSLKYTYYNDNIYMYMAEDFLITICEYHKITDECHIGRIYTAN
jgi:hypothetical protein